MKIVNEIKSKHGNKCLFLDRDGVINIDYGYVYKISDFKFREGIFKVLKSSKNLGFKIIIVTNQGGIGRGLYTSIDFYNLNNYMLSEFKENSIIIDDVFFCPFHPQKGLGNFKRNSFFRKPNPGMLIHAINKHKIDINKSLMIGDNNTDNIAAKQAGINNYINAKDKDWINLSLEKLKLLNLM